MPNFSQPRGDQNDNAPLLTTADTGTKNPYLIREHHTQFPLQLKVWTEFLGDYIERPFLINANLNGNLFYEVFEDTINPANFATRSNFK